MPATAILTKRSSLKLLKLNKRNFLIYSHRGTYD